MTDVAVISVLYRAKPAVMRWAEALRLAWERVDHAKHQLTVIAVDSASGDGTPDMLERQAPSIRVVRQQQNCGFAAGCNRGLREVRESAIVVLLNPDIAVDPTFFERLVDFAWSSDLAAVGPQIRTPRGHVEQSARSFPNATTGVFGRTTLLTRVFPRAALTRRQLQAVPERGAAPVDWVSGACLIAPRVRFYDVGPLDEQYWMYWEDADWCRRAANRGLRVEYRPELLAVHYQGSSAVTRPWRTSVAFHRSAGRYYRRYVAGSDTEALLATAVLAARLALKLAAASGRRAAAPARGVYIGAKSIMRRTERKAAPRPRAPMLRRRIRTQRTSLLTRGRKPRR